MILFNFKKNSLCIRSRVQSPFELLDFLDTAEFGSKTAVILTFTFGVC